MSTAEGSPARPRSANLRQACDLAIGALCGLYLYGEIVHAESVRLRDALAGSSIGGAIGFFLNASGPSQVAPLSARSLTFADQELVGWVEP